MRPKVLGLVGPTASGKSALALRAATDLGGEIVCMDSMQVYRMMDVGTAKPTLEEREAVPHHMLDVADPRDSYSVAQYAQDARAAIDGILARGRLPILCGGTGLYLRSLSYRMDFGRAPADPAVRERYEAMARERGAQAVHGELALRDPESAARLHPNDLRRVVRALEVFELTGRPLSEDRLPDAADGPYVMRLFALSWPRETLYARVEERARAMAEGGLPEEVKALLDYGVPPDAQSMQGLGYKELVPYVRGETSLEDALEQVMRRTRNYAKRQLTWFNADPRIRWLEGDAGMETLLDGMKRGLDDGQAV
ncbi:MAG TPA: tRNA (adenosine(37)-N6)-dimethylallyltransferase MiaA [Candidatus Limnocylindria bacterium]|nr:tRNA (adenosine(37)-N6)-dimethylallyltransferase MiaA [Candidatus Limnocylindria bacterium]